MKGFSGLIRLPSLPDVVQACALARLSGTLRIENDGMRAAFFVRDGEIVHAECGDSAGVAAAITVLGWKSGSFVIEDLVEPKERTIHDDWQHLLFEAARQEDEGADDEDWCAALPPSVLDPTSLWKLLVEGAATTPASRIAGCWDSHGAVEWLDGPATGATELADDWIHELSSSGSHAPRLIELVEPGFAAVVAWPGGGTSGEALVLADAVKSPSDMSRFGSVVARLQKILRSGDQS